MELRHLRYFVAIAASLSFTKAAAILRDRNSRGVCLTPAPARFPIAVSWRPKTAPRLVRDFVATLRA